MDLFTSLAITISTSSCSHATPGTDSQGFDIYPYCENHLSLGITPLFTYTSLKVQYQAPPPSSLIEVEYLFQGLLEVPPQMGTLLHQILVGNISTLQTSLPTLLITKPVTCLTQITTKVRLKSWYHPI